MRSGLRRRAEQTDRRPVRAVGRLVQHPQGVRRISPQGGRDIRNEAKPQTAVQRKAAKLPTAAQKGTKDTLRRGDFDFPPPRLRTTPLKRPNTRGAVAPLLEVSPGERPADGTGEKGRYGHCGPQAAFRSATVAMRRHSARRSAPYMRLSALPRARRSLWTLPIHDIRPGSGSGCWGARVCIFRAPELNCIHP